MNGRIAAMKELELKVERTLKMSLKEKIRVLTELQEIIKETPTEDAFWLRTQRNRIYYNLSETERQRLHDIGLDMDIDGEKEKYCNHKDEYFNDTTWRCVLCGRQRPRRRGG